VLRDDSRNTKSEVKGTRVRKVGGSGPYFRSKSNPIGGISDRRHLREFNPHLRLITTEAAAASSLTTGYGPVKHAVQ
jgi:hypothetical protein